jgi:hypothetical protein
MDNMLTPPNFPGAMNYSTGTNRIVTDRLSSKRLKTGSYHLTGGNYDILVLNV